MTAEIESVIYVADGPVGRITLNRPEKRNALNQAIVSGLAAALRAATQDKAVRVVLITGAGKDFCSGADLSALQKISGASVGENVEDAGSLLELFLLIRNLPLPVIAAVQGRALAGGCGLATACDLVLASASARFGYPEVKIGFVPAMVMAILRRNVSEKRAFELITRGGEIDADEAMQMGLINQVLPDERFEQAIEDYLRAFEKVSSSAVALSKQLLYQMDGLNFREGLHAGLDINVIARMTEECQKGIARFLRKE
ncbi:MAG: Enoyl-CoA hydratase/carnithine racemase [Acidobacteria bacterium]|nr:Enoyl-CoA hydratase/carnithine racemase [Acidobacteriota bacterium]